MEALPKEEQPQALPPAPEKKFTREQRRAMERFNIEAKTVHTKLVEQFYTFFMENDPESEAVTDKIQELSAKWKMWCGHKGANPEAWTLVQENCNDLKHQYLAIKNGTDKTSDAATHATAESL